MGIEPTWPGTQVTSGFEDRGGHQYPIQPRFEEQGLLYLEAANFTSVLLKLSQDLSSLDLKYYNKKRY